MRLIRQKIYRAFPELDRFDDERCVRFVNAARRGWVVKGIGLLLVLLTGAVITIAPPGLAILVLRFTSYGAMRGNSDLFGLFTTLVLTGCICGPLAGILMRDVLLRWRVRHVLRTRGSCFSCHYSLLGLPIGAGNQVTCPECQTVNEVDEAMSELSSSDAAGPRVSSDPAAVEALKAQAARRLRWRGRMKVAVCTAAAVFAICWGGYEYFLRQQAAAAAAARPGIAGLMAYAESLQPVPASPEELDGWVLYDKAVAAKLRVDGTISQLPPRDGSGKELREDFSAVYAEPTANAQENERRKLQADAATEAIAAYEAQGVFVEFDAIAGARRCLMPLQVAPNAPLLSISLSQNGPGMRNVYLMNARMTLAARHGDRAQVIAAYRTGLALARLHQMQPASTGLVLGLLFERQMHDQLRRLLITAPQTFDIPTLKSLMAAAREQCWEMPPSHLVAGDALCKLDTLAWIFSSPGRVRFGKFTPGLGNAFGGWGPLGAAELTGSLGTFESNRAELNARTQTWTKLAGLRACESATVPVPRAEASHALVSLVDYPPWSRLQHRDATMLIRNGTFAMLGVELYRREHGDPPPTLGAAIEELPVHLMLDPFAPVPNQQLCYKRIGASSDRLARPYLIYSVGGDFTDDGGATPPMPYMNEFSLPLHMNMSGLRGVDYIINDDR